MAHSERFLARVEQRRFLLTRRDELLLAEG